MSPSSASIIVGGIVSCGERLSTYKYTPFPCTESSFSYNKFVLARFGAIALAGAAQIYFVCNNTFMTLKRTPKKKLITKHQVHKKDTGSPNVQIAILSKEIAMLTAHLQEHKGDFSARKGLLGKVARRRKLLNYLKMNLPEQYQTVLEANKLTK